MNVRHYVKSKGFDGGYIEEFQKTGDYSDDELRFVVFCIESLVEDMNVDPVIVHDALVKESDTGKGIY